MRIGCAAIIPSEDLPCRMEAGQTKSFKLKLQATTETGASETRFPLYLYTTSQGQAEIVLTLVERPRRSWNASRAIPNHRWPHQSETAMRAMLLKTLGPVRDDRPALVAADWPEPAPLPARSWFG